MKLGVRVNSPQGKFAVTHNLSRHPIYKNWAAMMARCYEENHVSKKYYQEKGIKVCQEWHSVVNFAAWSEANGYQKGLQLDRIDGNKDYCPENCRWVSRTVNMRNREATILDRDKVIEIKKLVLTTNMTQRSIAKMFGCTDGNIRAIIRGRSWRDVKLEDARA